MDLLSRIAGWLGENEATISAVVGIAVLTGIVFAGVRSLARRRAEPSAEKTPAVSPEAASAAEASSPDLDPLTVPGFEGRPAIAVLPFDNLSGDPDQEYFADGIAEDLITRLSSWREFPVIARNSSFTYKGKAVNVKQVSQDLGVRYVVEGSVRRSESRVRIAAQLIDATTGHHVWAENYDRELQEIFELQDEITQVIVASMYPELTRSEQEHAARRQPDNLDAWDCLVRGQWHLLKVTSEDNAKARSLFEKAVELDPASAKSFAGLGMTHTFDAIFGWTDSRAQSIGEANRLARRSLELDEREPLAYAALVHASALAGRQQQMIAAAEHAIELNPNNPGPIGELGFALSYTGRRGDAIAYLERAMRLSPKDNRIFLWLTGMGFVHFSEGRYKEAASWLERSRQSRPEFPIAQRALVATYAQLGRMEEAQTELQENLRRAPDESVSRVKERISYAAPEFLEPYLDGLRKAGLPE
jgi:TolB-like protein/Flp pilus assembly protein TadD